MSRHLRLLLHKTMKFALETETDFVHLCNVGLLKLIVVLKVGHILAAGRNRQTIHAHKFMIGAFMRLLHITWMGGDSSYPTSTKLREIQGCHKIDSPASMSKFCITTLPKIDGFPL